MLTFQILLSKITQTLLMNDLIIMYCHLKLQFSSVIYDTLVVELDQEIKQKKKKRDKAK